VGGSFADVIDHVNPAVVHVTVVESTNGRDPSDRDAPRRGEGSGFIVDPEGYILTNHHVVATPARIRVRLADKTELPAVLVGSDSNTDLALLKVSYSKPLPWCRWATPTSSAWGTGSSPSATPTVWSIP
jgi:serine protease Do